MGNQDDEVKETVVEVTTDEVAKEESANEEGKAEEGAEPEKLRTKGEESKNIAEIENTVEPKVHGEEPTSNKETVKGENESTGNSNLADCAEVTKDKETEESNENNIIYHNKPWVDKRAKKVSDFVKRYLDSNESKVGDTKDTDKQANKTSNSTGSEDADKQDDKYNHNSILNFLAKIFISFYVFVTVIWIGSVILPFIKIDFRWYEYISIMLMGGALHVWGYAILKNLDSIHYISHLFTGSDYEGILTKIKSLVWPWPFFEGCNEFEVNIKRGYAFLWVLVVVSISRAVWVLHLFGIGNSRIFSFRFLMSIVAIALGVAGFLANYISYFASIVFCFFTREIANTEKIECETSRPWNSKSLRRLIHISSRSSMSFLAVSMMYLLVVVLCMVPEIRDGKRTVEEANIAYQNALVYEAESGINNKAIEYTVNFAINQMNMRGANISNKQYIVHKVTNSLERHKSYAVRKSKENLERCTNHQRELNQFRVLLLGSMVFICGISFIIVSLLPKLYINRLFRRWKYDKVAKAHNPKEISEIWASNLPYVRMEVVSAFTSFAVDICSLAVCILQLNG